MSSTINGEVGLDADDCGSLQTKHDNIFKKAKHINLRKVCAIVLWILQIDTQLFKSHVTVDNLL